MTKQNGRRRRIYKSYFFNQTSIHNTHMYNGNKNLMCYSSGGINKGGFNKGKHPDIPSRGGNFVSFI